MQTDRPELHRAVAHIYRAFVTFERTAVRASKASDAASERHWRASLDNKDLSYDDFDGAVLDLEYEIEHKLLADPDGPVLHAGAVADGTRIIIIAGSSGAGKSTVSLELVRRGFRYLTDEFVALDADGMALHPFPRAATLKRNWPHVPFGDILELDSESGYMGFFAPEHCSDLQSVALTSPQFIFLERRAEGHAHARNLTKHETLVALICSTFEIRGREATVWPALSNLAVRAKACKLVYQNAESDLDLALELLGRQ